MIKLAFFVLQFKSILNIKPGIFFLIVIHSILVLHKRFAIYATFFSDLFSVSTRIPKASLSMHCSLISMRIEYTEIR